MRNKLTPPKQAISVTTNNSLGSQVTIALDPKTILIEVTAIDAGIYLKYSTGVTSTSYDEYIATGQTRHYLVPEMTTRPDNIYVIQDASVGTAKLRLIQK